MQENQKGYLQLIAFSLFIGSVGTFVKLIHGLDVYAMLFFRYGIAALCILAVVLFQGRLKELKPVLFGRTLLTGVCLSVASLLYFSSILGTSVSNAVFLLYTAPIFSVILARIFFKEKIQKETYISGAIALLGIIFILDPSTFSLNIKETVGILCGLGAGFFYAAQGLVAKPVAKQTSGYYTAFWQSVVVAFLFLFFIDGNTLSIAQENTWQLIGLGIFGAGIPTVLFMHGIRHVKAQQIFIITSLEPLSATAYALVFLHEVPTLTMTIGAILIFLGVFRLTWSRRTIQAL